MMFRQIGPTEILIILGVIVLLFGGRKLPEVARGSGRALRIFKSEIKGLHEDEEDSAQNGAADTGERDNGGPGTVDEAIEASGPGADTPTKPANNGQGNPETNEAKRGKG